MSCRGFEPVCSNDEAREYFERKGLKYSDIRRDDIKRLRDLCAKELKKSNKTGETSVNTMKMSDRIDIEEKEDGSIYNAFMYMNSHYFRERECISFNRDGFIGFAGWADMGNLNPIKRAFLKWCDEMKDQELPMMLDDTINAFDCCIQMPPKCDDCPLMNDLCAEYEKDGKAKLKISVRYWLSKVEYD